MRSQSPTYTHSSAQHLILDSGILIWIYIHLCNLLRRIFKHPIVGGVICNTLWAPTITSVNQLEYFLGVPSTLWFQFILLFFCLLTEPIFWLLEFSIIWTLTQIWDHSKCLHSHNSFVILKVWGGVRIHISVPVPRYLTHHSSHNNYHQLSSGSRLIRILGSYQVMRT